MFLRIFDKIGFGIDTLEIEENETLNFRQRLEIKIFNNQLLFVNSAESADYESRANQHTTVPPLFHMII